MLVAYDRMRSKCEKYTYLNYRKFSDIAVNDIYAIEYFNPDIMSKIFSKLL